MTTIRWGARAGAAAFVLGLTLVGPQGLGVAAADTGDTGDAAVAAGSPEGRGDAARTGRAGRQLGVGRPAQREVTTQSRGAAALRPAKAPSATANRAGAPAARPVVVEVPLEAVAAAAVKAEPKLQVTARITPRRTAAVTGRSELGAAVVSLTRPVAVVPSVPGLTALRDAVGSAETTLFNTLENVLVDLPATDVNNFLAGALLMVRQKFFNQAPQATGATSYTSADGLVNGRVGAIDLEGGTLSYTVVAGPKFGTVEVDANGLYVYTPGADYAGSDVFTVDVSSNTPGLNLLTPFADNTSRLVNVRLGAPPPATPFADPAGQSPQFPDDVAVYLPNASGHITVGRTWLGPTASVTLTDTTSATEVSWMDSTGDLGQMSMADAAQLWPKFEAKALQSGGGVDLGVSFSADDGTSVALILSRASLSTNSDGQYVFTGNLSADPASRPDALDQWDVVGSGYKTQYNAFRTIYGLAGPGIPSPAPITIDFQNAAVFSDTASAISYQQYGLYAFDHQQTDYTYSAGSPVTSATSDAVNTAVTAETATSAVTASIPLEQSFVIGRKDGSVELWTGGVKSLLQAPTVNGASVVSIVSYDRPLQDADGAMVESSFTGSIDGNVLTVSALGAGSTVTVGAEIAGTGIQAGTVITKFVVPETSRCIEKKGDDCVKSTGGQGGEIGGLGTYEVSIPQSVAAMVITQPSVLAKAPGFVVALSDGTVRLWSPTSGWAELQNSLWGTGSTRTVKGLTTFGDGVAVGLDDGSLRVWSGPDGQAADAWKNNWVNVRDCQGSTGCGAVEKMAAVKGGVVVANGPARLLFFSQSNPGVPVFLQGAPAGWRTTAMTAFADGVAVGLQNGGVYYWDLRSSGGPAFTRDAKELIAGGASGSPVNTLAPYLQTPSSTDQNLIVGYGGLGSVDEIVGYDSSKPFVVPLHDKGWGSAVTSMTTFSSAAVNNVAGVIVGLANGSVQLWTGKTSNTGQDFWTELHNPGWESSVATLIPFRQNLPDDKGNVVPRDGVVVGLENGSVQQWSGLITGKTGQADWTQIVCGPQGCVGPPPTPDPSPSLGKDGTLKAAVDFAKGAVKDGATWGTNIGGAHDPLFYGTNLLPPCSQNNTCDGQFVPIAVSVEKSPLEREWPQLDASVKLSYDVNAIAYGYAFMPNGFWAKLNPGKWSLAALGAVETGPSLTLKLGQGGTINVPRQNLVDWGFSTPGPLGIDRVALGLGVDGELTAQLACGVSNCPDKLNAHAYVVPGVLLTYNTQAKPGGVGLGFGWYPDLEYSDFTKVTGASVAATLTPYATLSYGIFTPKGWWLIGGWSLFKLGVGYENPLTTTIAAGQGLSASLALGSQGFITTHAGILESLTSKLIWDNRFQVYDVNSTYTL